MESAFIPSLCDSKVCALPACLLLPFPLLRIYTELPSRSSIPYQDTDKLLKGGDQGWNLATHQKKPPTGRHTDPFNDGLISQLRAKLTISMKPILFHLLHKTIRRHSVKAIQTHHIHKVPLSNNFKKRGQVLKDILKHTKNITFI